MSNKFRTLPVTYHQGFTLIELLIVIAVIGILATLVIANVLGVRQRGRDSQRKADLRQMQYAVELYRADRNAYPLTASFPACGGQFAFGGVIYLQKIPCDPTNLGQYKYTYTSNGSTYTITACLENTNDTQKDGANVSSLCTGGSTNWSYTVANP